MIFSSKIHPIPSPTAVDVTDLSRHDEATCFDDSSTTSVVARCDIEGSIQRIYPAFVGDQGVFHHLKQAIGVDLLTF